MRLQAHDHEGQARNTVKLLDEWIERNYGTLFSEVHIVKYGTLKHSTIHEKDTTLIDDDDEVKKGDTIDANDTETLIEWICNLIESEGL